jgi:Tfp pilus assembly protein PilO
MRVGHKGQLGVLVAVQLVVLLLVYFIAYRPTAGAIAKSEQELSELSGRQAELRKQLEANPAPAHDIAHYKAEIRRLENRIPPEFRVSWLSARIAEAMNKHGIDLRSASDWREGGRRPPVPDLKGLQKQMTVRCTARDLQAFLVQINKLPFAVIVEDLRVTRDQKWGTVSAEIRLATFVLRTRPLAPKSEVTKS